MGTAHRSLFARFTAALLSASLVIVSPGLGAYEAAAQTLGRPGGSAGSRGRIPGSNYGPPNRISTRLNFSPGSQAGLKSALPGTDTPIPVIPTLSGTPAELPASEPATAAPLTLLKPSGLIQEAPNLKNAKGTPVSAASNLSSVAEESAGLSRALPGVGVNEARERADFTIKAKRGGDIDVSINPALRFSNGLLPSSPKIRREQETSSLGQGVAAGVTLAGAGVSAYFGLQDISLWTLPALAWAGALATAGLGYAGLALRSAAALWSQFSQPGEGVGAQGPPSFWSRVGASLRTPIATPNSNSAAFDSLAPHARAVIDAHENAHRRGAGELRAYAAQTKLHGQYLFGELKAGAQFLASIPRWSWNSAKSAAATLRLMYSGDAETAPVIAPLEKGINRTRVFLFLDGIFAISMAILTGPLLNTALMAGKAGITLYAPPLAMFTALLIAAFVGYMIVERKHVYLSRVLGLQAAAAYRVALQKSLLSQEMDFHLQQGSGVLAGRLLNDTNYLSTKNVNVRLSLLHYALYLVFGVGMMLFTHLPLSLLVLSVIPVLGFLNGHYGDKLTDLSFKQTDKKAELMRYGQESLQQAETVKTFASAEQELKRYGAKVDELKALGEEDARLTSNYNLVASAVSEFFTKHLIYILGAWILAAAWGLGMGQIVTFTIFAGFAKYAFSGLSSNYLLFRRYQASSETIRSLLRRVPAVADAPGAVALPEGPGTLRFEGVKFSYSDRTDSAPVLNDINFEIPGGKTVAFVGETGSGKSTIARLLLRLWEPTAGRITIDGKDLRGITRQSLMERVAVVPQETRLFNASIGANMLYGSEDATPERLDKAIRMAGATYVYDTQRFPQGLDTPVAEGGGRLSGGERQRVAIVRALLRAPAVLILDEATSALDNRSERDVQKSLEALRAGPDGSRPTTVVVAHRLSTIRSADIINYLEKGVIVESGSHEQLLAQNGRYAKLWREGRYEDSDKKTTEAAVAAQPVSIALAANNSSPAPIALRPPLRQRLQTKLFSIKTAVQGALSSVHNFVMGDKSARPYLDIRRMVLTAGLLIVNAALWIAGSNMIGRLLDAAEKAPGMLEAATSDLWMLSAGVGGVFLAVMVLERLTTWLTGVLRVRTVAELRKALMRRLHAREMNFHLQNDSASLATRLNDDVEALAKKNVEIRLPLFRDIISLAISTALLIHANLIVGILVLGMLPILGVVNGYFGQKSEKLYTVFGARRAELGRKGQETLEHVQTVKVFAREDTEVKRYGEKADALVETGVEGARISATAHMLSSSLTDFFTKHLIYIVGAWALALAFGLTVGQITAMTFYAGFIKASFDGLSSKWLDYKQAHGETEVVRGWLSEESAIADRPDAKPLPPGRGAVTFEGVGFAYSQNGSGGALSDITFSIEPGQTVAFVGASGSGKSTILKLLQRLWEPRAGRVLIDGQDIRQTTLGSMGKAIAKVPQDTRLFDESLRYNMLYGSPQASHEQLLAAIRAARAEFVFDRQSFPQGLDTPAGEGGAKLSGGQRQRVAIVRALLKSPRILLLDEATSALDKKTEREIQETLDRLTSEGGDSKPTTLVVAHNLTTIMNADKIVVMDLGRIVETGTHAELLAKDGYYKRLWQRSQSENAP